MSRCKTVSFNSLPVPVGYCGALLSYPATLHLIEAVRKEANLWDQNRKFFENEDFAIAVWNSIITELYHEGYEHVDQSIVAWYNLLASYFEYRNNPVQLFVNDEQYILRIHEFMVEQPEYEQMTLNFYDVCDMPILRKYFSSKCYSDLKAGPIPCYHGQYFPPPQPAFVSINRQPPNARPAKSVLRSNKVSKPEEQKTSMQNSSSSSMASTIQYSSVIQKELETEKVKKSASEMVPMANAKLERRRKGYEFDSGDEYSNEPMTYDEKQQLCVNIKKLPMNKIQQLIDIVKAQVKFENNDPELGIDFERQSPATLREMEAFVAAYLKTKSEKKQEDSAEVPGIVPENTQEAEIVPKAETTTKLAENEASKLHEEAKDSSMAQQNTTYTLQKDPQLKQFEEIAKGMDKPTMVDVRNKLKELRRRILESRAEQEAEAGNSQETMEPKTEFNLAPVQETAPQPPAASDNAVSSDITVAPVDLAAPDAVTQLSRIIQIPNNTSEYFEINKAATNNNSADQKTELEAKKNSLQELKKRRKLANEERTKPVKTKVEITNLQKPFAAHSTNDAFLILELLRKRPASEQEKSKRSNKANGNLVHENSQKPATAPNTLAAPCGDVELTDAVALLAPAFIQLSVPEPQNTENRSRHHEINRTANHYNSDKMTELEYKKARLQELKRNRALAIEQRRAAEAKVEVESVQEHRTPGKSVTAPQNPSVSDKATKTESNITTIKGMELTAVPETVLQNLQNRESFIRNAVISSYEHVLLHFVAAILTAMIYHLIIN